MSEQHRLNWQKETEDAMFSHALRSDLMDEQDLTNAMLDQQISTLIEKGGTIDLSSLKIESTTDSKIMQIEEINQQFSELITEVSDKVRNALTKVEEESTFVKPDKSWRSMSMFDRAGKCPECDKYFPVSRLSNTSHLAKEVRASWKSINSIYAINDTKEQIRSPELEKGEGKPKAIFIKNNSGNYVVNWQVFREKLSIHCSDFEQKPEMGKMKRSELLKLNKKHQDWAKIAAGLILCDRRPLSCPNSKCNSEGERTNLWKFNPLNSERPFHRISYFATKAILEETIGSVVTRAPKHIVVVNPQGEKIKVKMGKIDNQWSKRNKRHISEAVLTASRVLDDFDIEDGYSIKKSDGERTRIYVSVNHSIVEKLAGLIERIRPVEAFIREGKSVLEHKDWASNCAGQVLHVIHRSGLLFEVEKTKDFSHQSGKTPKHASNLIRLNKKISDKISAQFTSKMANGMEYNALEAMISKETTPPMISPPVPRTIEGGGGLLTVNGQKRYKMITEESQYKKFGYKRLKVSNSAVDAINTLQSTQWAVDPKMVEIARSVVKDFVKENIANNFSIRYEEEYDQHYLDFNGSYPKVTFGQVSSWLNTFAFIDRLGDILPGLEFWHPWAFDWRGRMVTISTMLSPQNDDFSRGLIRFANSEKLTESGWKWLCRRVAALYRGQPIPKSFDETEANELKATLSLLDDKTFESFDVVSSNPLFIEMMRAIANDPEGTFACWGEGDVFRSKAEGFQRLALTRAFVAALDNGGVGAEVRIPLNLDASSSIYQHASALMRDPKMAESVNVLPNAGNKPNDVYQAVVDKLKEMWNKENPFEEYGISQEKAEKLLEKILTRNLAKRPIMTIGYGASQGAMIKSLLTHNGEDNGICGMTAFAKENWPHQQVEFENPTADNKEEYNWRMNAHPSSFLFEALEENDIPKGQHELIARKIIKGLFEAVEEELPGFNSMISKMKEAVKESRNKSVSKPTNIQNPKRNTLSWTVKDGTTIENLQLVDAEMDSISAWDGVKVATKIIRDKARALLPEVLRFAIPNGPHEFVDFSTLSSSGSAIVAATSDEEYDEWNDAYNDLFSHEFNKITRIKTALEESDKSTACIDMEDLTIYWSKLFADLNYDDVSTVDDVLEDKLPKEAESIAKAIKQFTGEYNTTFSRQQITDERNINSEMRGIAPQFIHSLDACHMRMVIAGLNKRFGISDIWSVHDAFGCHPNHIEKMREIVVTTFAIVHSEYISAAEKDKDKPKARGIISQVYFENTGKELKLGDMCIDDVAHLNEDGTPVSKYLIS